jgi:hypothetical protein
LSDKEVKSLRILDLISKRGVISRTEISKITGINIVSISNYMHKYIAKKFIIEKGFDISTGGRKPELVELDKDDNRIVGVEMARDFIRVVLTDIGLNLIGKALAPNLAGKDAATLACSLVGEVIEKAGLKAEEIKAIGVGLYDDDHKTAGKDMRERLKTEVFLADAPSCAAFGERRMNDKVPAGDFLYIYSDIGYGVIVKEDGNRIALGESRYLSPWKETLGAVSLAKSDVARGVGTTIVEIAQGKMEGITTDTIAESARGNDEVALSIMRSVGMSLGLRIAYLVNLFNPRGVVIGGGIEKAGNLVLDPIKKTVKKLSLKDHASAASIMPAILGEDSVSVGAAFLAAREMFLKI